MPLTLSGSEVQRYYAARLPDLVQRGAEWRSPCPIHGGQHGSFAVNPNTGLAFCHSKCNRGWDVVSLEMELCRKPFGQAYDDVLRLIGREPTVGQRIVATYDYQDPDGRLLFQVVRYEPKSFRQRRPDGRGDWHWNLNGVRTVLYRLPRVLAAPWVLIVEGERDVETLEKWRRIATCNPMGAGKWRPEYSAYLRGKHCIIIPDNDEPGRKHAAKIAEDLLPVATDVRLIMLPKGKDVSEWASLGGTDGDLCRLVGDAPVITPETLLKWKERWIPAREAATVATEWPALEPIQSELPTVAPFAEELLPESFRALAVDVADRMQVPLDYPAAVAVLCLAGSVNRRAQMQPKANDTGWTIVPNLWGGIVAPPGFLKSPVIQAVTKPLNQIQTEWIHEHEEAEANFTQANVEYELQFSAWKEQYKANMKRGKAAPSQPDDRPVEPKLRRLIANDATFEALHQMMNENPAGILVVRDELTGWLSQLDRPGREGERAFCLQAWNGDTGHTMDRIGRGTIHVEACCMSLLGGIQPPRLRSYLVEALEDGPSNDGLIQRFQVLVWPDTDPEWKYVDRAPSVASERQAATVLQNLLGLDAENPQRFRFAPDAQELFTAWLTELEKQVRSDELHPALTAHLSKYRSLMPSLAMLFQLAELAAGLGSTTVVTLENAQRAAAWCEYLASHAQRIYSCVVTPQLRSARELADKLKRRRLAADGTFSCREAYLKGWSGLSSPEAVKQAASVLADAGWVRELFSEADSRGGRPSCRYEVNPEVWA